MEQTQTVEQVINRIGFGRFQLKLLLICGASWAADGMEVLLIAFALPAVTREWNLTTAQAGFIGTAIFLGMLAGAWFWGTISDYIGRRTGFQATVLIDSLFGFLSALSPSYLWLALLRGLTGFGVGGTLPVDYSIFAEYLPTKQRGRYLVYLESFWALGSLVGAGLAWLLVPTAGWRVLLAVSAVPGLMIYFIRRHVPESPRYLLVTGREDEAHRVLQQMAEENSAPVTIDRVHVEPRRQRATIPMLWTSTYARTTLMLWLVWFCISLGYYGVFIWLPSVLVARGFDFMQTYGYVFLMALAQIPGYLSAAYLVERSGRRATLAVYLILSGVFTLLFATVSSAAGIILAASLMSFFSLGAWGALYAYTPELYPTEIRSTGMGWASGMSRIAGAIAPVLGGLLLPVSLLGALGLYGLSFALGGLIVLGLGSETRDLPLPDMAVEKNEPRPA